jgi:nodulation protein F
MFNAEFETVLRGHLPFLGPDEKITADLPLREMGLDSMGIVALLVDLEGAFDVRFHDDALVIEVFNTAGTLWTVLAGLITHQVDGKAPDLEHP